MEFNVREISIGNITNWEFKGWHNENLLCNYAFKVILHKLTA